MVGFVVTVGVIKPHPRREADRVRDAPEAAARHPRAGRGRRRAARLCWDSDALVNGSPRTFRFSARIVSSGVDATTLAVHARLTGANFAASRAAATVQVPPRPVVACPSSSGPAPTGRIAC